MRRIGHVRIARAHAHADATTSGVPDTAYKYGTNMCMLVHRKISSGSKAASVARACAVPVISYVAPYLCLEC